MEIKSLRITLQIFLLFALTITSFRLWAAACCGGSFAAPALISGDEKQTITLSWSESKVASYADRQGRVLTQNGINERSLQLSGATLIQDRWQVGALTSLKQQVRSDQEVESKGLGDSSLLVGFEALPEWDYNPFKPHGFVYLQLTAPTGVSLFESKKMANVDVTGNGFWTLGAGTLLTKNWLPWDAQLQLEWHHGWSRTFSASNNQKISATPEPGASGFLQGGYSLKDWRFGLGLRHSEEGAITTSGATNGKVQPKRWTSAIMSVNYLLQQQWACSLSYVDDTWFGSPSNAMLSRAIIFSLQRRWAR